MSNGPTLYAQVKDELAKLGVTLSDSQRMRLNFMPNMMPLNGSVEIDGRITHDFFCLRGHSDGVVVTVAE